MTPVILPSDAAKAAPSEPLKCSLRVGLELEADPDGQSLEQIVALRRACLDVEPETTLLSFAEGYVLQQLHRAEPALRALAPVLRYDNALTPYAWLLRGELHLELEHFMDARRAFQMAIVKLPAGEASIRAKLGLTRVALRAGNADDAAYGLKAILQFNPRSLQASAIKLELARALSASGKTEEARAILEQLWAGAPTSPEALQARSLLETLLMPDGRPYQGPSVKTRYARSRKLLSVGEVAQGLDGLLELASDPSARKALGGQFDLVLAKAFFQAKRYREAYPRFDAYYARATPASRPDIAFLRAQSRSRYGEIEGAVGEYLELVRQFPKSSQAPIALRKVGQLRLDQGQLEASAQAFSTLRTKYPKSAEVPQATWFMAWTAFRQGQLPKAREELLILSRSNSEFVPAALYWLARVATLEGQSDVARGYYRRVLGLNQPTAYGAMAEAMLGLERGGTPTLDESDVGGASESARVKVTNGLRDGGMLVVGTALFAHRAELEQIVPLLRLGLSSWAEERLGDLERRLQGKPAKLALAQWYQDVGAFSRAARLAGALGYGWGVPTPGTRSLGWRLAWPMAHDDERLGVQRGLRPVPPGLLYGIMRQESAYRPWLTSKAGARGILQIMPETAQDAGGRRQQPLQRDGLLYQPSVAIRYGLWHLEDLINTYQGLLPVVIAAYNAGPPVDKWLKERPPEPLDVWIEEIPYDETRHYVKQVMANLWVYDRLYGIGASPLKALNERSVMPRGSD